MNTLRRLNPEVLELDSETPNEQAWLGGGCLLMALSGILGLAILGSGADGAGGLLRWIGLACLATFGLGIVVTWLAFLLQESYLLGATGVRLRRRWLGHSRERWLARADQIHCLALDGSERGPRSWRLMLVCNDAQTHELAGYSRHETEDQRWKEVCDLAHEVALALATAVRLPEGLERERRLQVSPGQPPAIDYAEFPEFTDREIRSIIKSMAVLLFLVLATVGLAFWLRFQGHL